MDTPEIDLYHKNKEYEKGAYLDEAFSAEIQKFRKSMEEMDIPKRLVPLFENILWENQEEWLRLRGY